MIALGGSHRAGKSTIAKEFVKQNPEFTLIQSSASAIFKKMGFDVNQKLTFDERMSLQEAILDAHIAQIRTAKSKWISDRSSLDMAAYTMLDWFSVPTKTEQDRLADYIHRCMNAAHNNYALCMIIPPVLPYVEEEGKPANNQAFQYAVHTMICGMIREPRACNYTVVLDSSIVDNEQRVNVLKSAWEYTMTNSCPVVERVSYH